jgi:hypothetical protein
MRAAIRRSSLVVVVVVLAFGWISPRQAWAQQAPPPSQELAYLVDSGPVANTAHTPQVVISFPVIVQGAPWLRLDFAGIELAGDPARGTGSILRMTSTRDAEVQELDENGVRAWQRTSAYFNGDTVLVEVLAQPNTGINRVLLQKVVAGLDAPGFPDVACGPDPRVPSNDGRSGRLLPPGCTAFMIDDCKTCFCTAGHCGPNSGVVQFNVPFSTPGGTLVNPPIEDQFPVDNASRQNQNAGVGADWSYFGCGLNNLGQTAFEHQLVRYAFGPPPAFNASEHIRLNGYGTDTTPPDNNQIQQDSYGNWNSLNGTYLTFSSYVEGGNSGTGIIHEESGIVIGITTHTSCLGSVQNNYGTRQNLAALQTALANPLGVCQGASNCIAVGHNYCTPGPRFCVIGATGTASIAANNLVLHANNIPSNKPGIFMYSLSQQSVPFGNGRLCVGGAQSIHRLPGVNSGAGTTFTYAVDYNALPAGGPISAGQVWNFQSWFRVGGGQTETTDGLQIAFTN